MLLKANCKINIGLHVVRRRSDGYHDLQTVFYPVYGLYDLLEVQPDTSRSDITFHTRGIEVDCEPDKNLVVLCYRRMKERYAQIGGVNATLQKNIPYGAGLGGGSSDAACMAIALNELFALGLGKVELAEEVKPLGADCPFFIYNTPCYATGIGEVLTPMEVNLNGLRLVMIKPEAGVSTKEAYAGVQPDGKEWFFAPITDPYTMQPADWQRYRNDFEPSVFALFPAWTTLKQRLLDAGALYAAMSGSGSTIYGLFDESSGERKVSDADIQSAIAGISAKIIYNGKL